MQNIKSRKPITLNNQQNAIAFGGNDNKKLSPGGVICALLASLLIGAGAGSYTSYNKTSHDHAEQSVKTTAAFIRELDPKGERFSNVEAKNGTADSTLDLQFVETKSGEKYTIDMRSREVKITLPDGRKLKPTPLASFLKSLKENSNETD